MSGKTSKQAMMMRLAEMKNKKMSKFPPQIMKKAATQMMNKIKIGKGKRG